MDALKKYTDDLDILLYLQNSKFCALSLKRKSYSFRSLSNMSYSLRKKTIESVRQATHFEELTENIIKSSVAVLVRAATPERSFFSLLHAY